MLSELTRKFNLETFWKNLAILQAVRGLSARKIKLTAGYFSQLLAIIYIPEKVSCLTFNNLWPLVPNTRNEPIGLFTYAGMRLSCALTDFYCAQIFH